MKELTRELLNIILESQNSNLKKLVVQDGIKKSCCHHLHILEENLPSHHITEMFYWTAYIPTSTSLNF